MKVKKKSVIRIFGIALLIGVFFNSGSEAEVNIAKEHFERGAEYHLNGNNKKAIVEFKKSLLYNKEDPNTHYYLALIYELTNQPVKAIRHMLKAEKYFEAEGRDYWKERSRIKVNDYYYFYEYKKEEFEKTENN